MQPRCAPVVALAAVLTVGGAACGGEDAAERPQPADTGTAPDEGTVREGDALAAQEAQAREALAETLSVAESGIRVVTAEQVQWRSGALGCPQPGQGYTQAITPGYRIVLEVDGQTYAFHGAEGGEPFLCEDPEEPAGQASG